MKKINSGHLKKATLKFRTFSAISALSLGLVFSSAVNAGQVLTVAQENDPQSLDPIDTFSLSWGSMGSNIFDGLVFRNENLDILPGLAKEWSFLEDGKRIRFKLREGVTFHNGEPFNAESVKYTFDRMLGEQGKTSPQRSNYTSIERVEILDDHTVDFVMKNPDPVLITKLSGYGAMIVPKKYIEEVGEKAFDMKPVGTGPFSVVNYTPSVGLKLEKNPNYWNGKAKVDEVNIKFIPEASTRMAELLSGGVDISLNIPVASVETIRNNDRVELVDVNGPTVALLRFKTRDSITSDIRVRKAINMAIDKKMIVDILLDGLGSTISSAQGTKSLGYNPDIQEYSYDPAGAKALLQQAGVNPGTTITLDTRNNDDTFLEVAQVISAYLGAVGLNVKIRTHESGVYSTEIVPKGNTGEMFYFRWGGWTFDFDNTAYLLYHSGERWNPYNNDEKLDALLEKQRLTYSTEVRENILREVASYAHENALDIPLYNTSTLYGVSKKVKGFTPAPDDRARYMDVYKD
ncbi:ABC transporter substrate-binding protein [Parasalinivibrio latis]|uniref:ABC transporter substrate-binding protein n=1 Tax=Parasalinivibrio latis TaxID=2952610 RepID=UPI0030E05BA7